MKNNTVVLSFLLIITIIACAPEKKASLPPIIELAKVSEQASSNLEILTEEQNSTTDVNRMFEIDELISNIKQKSSDTLKRVLQNLSDSSINFIQTANTDKIEIQSLKIVDVNYNEVVVEANVKALDNSAFSGPHVGLAAASVSDSTIDVGGGISGDSKLIAGTTYIFKGKIFNINNINSKFGKIVFQEDIKQW